MTLTIHWKNDHDVYLQVEIPIVASLADDGMDTRDGYRTRHRVGVDPSYDKATEASLSKALAQL